jgi:putative hydrolase of the HAD superfamily
LHVGDDAVADVEGARAAGITPVWINRSGEPWPRESQPPLTIRSLAELVELVP